jgi:hypothetical protein
VIHETVNRDAADTNVAFSGARAGDAATNVAPAVGTKYSVRLRPSEETCTVADLEELVAAERRTGELLKE